MDEATNCLKWCKRLCSCRGTRERNWRKQLVWRHTHSHSHTQAHTHTNIRGTHAYAYKFCTKPEPADCGLVCVERVATRWFWEERSKDECGKLSARPTTTPHRWVTTIEKNAHCQYTTNNWYIYIFKYSIFPLQHYVSAKWFRQVEKVQNS